MSSWDNYPLIAECFGRGIVFLIAQHLWQVPTAAVAGIGQERAASHPRYSTGVRHDAGFCSGPILTTGAGGVPLQAFQKPARGSLHRPLITPTVFRSELLVMIYQLGRSA